MLVRCSASSSLWASSCLSQYLSVCLSDHKDVYSYNFPEDKKFLKLLGMLTIPPPLVTLWRFFIVYGVFFLETLQTVLSGTDLYYWFASGYGNLKHLTNPHLAPFDVPIIESLVSLSVQFFFAYHIWVLSGKRFLWYCLIICLVSLSKICCNLDPFLRCSPPSLMQ